MDWKNGKALIVVGFIVIGVITGGAVVLAGLLFQPTSYGQNFLLQLVQRNEDAALNYLTPAFRDVVRENCPRSAVTECFWERVDSDWGSLVSIQFMRRDPSNQRELFHLTWSQLDDRISVVLEARQSAGSYLVDGWRGFTLSSDAALDDALLLGLRDDNALLVPTD